MEERVVATLQLAALLAHAVPPPPPPPTSSPPIPTSPLQWVASLLPSCILVEEPRLPSTSTPSATTTSPLEGVARRLSTAAAGGAPLVPLYANLDGTPPAAVPSGEGGRTWAWVRCEGHADADGGGGYTAALRRHPAFAAMEAAVVSWRAGEEGGGAPPRMPVFVVDGVDSLLHQVRAGLSPAAAFGRLLAVWTCRRCMPLTAAGDPLPWRSARTTPLLVMSCRDATAVPPALAPPALPSVYALPASAASSLPAMPPTVVPAVCALLPHALLRPAAGSHAPLPPSTTTSTGTAPAHLAAVDVLVKVAHAAPPAGTAAPTHTAAAAAIAEPEPPAWAPFVGYAAVTQEAQRRVVDPVRAFLAATPATHDDLAARMRAMHVRPPTGLLIYGPSGCGKSLLASTLATRLGLPALVVQVRRHAGGCHAHPTTHAPPHDSLNPPHTYVVPPAAVAVRG